MARLIESVVGHKSEISRLLELKHGGRWPHAFIFAGPPGIGKKKVAMVMAQVAVCESSEVACGVCGPCIRIEKRQSESLFVIEPDAEMSKPGIKIEKIRDLLEALSLSSGGGIRFIVIDQAHTMNLQTANALLKTLEEPSENVFFVLIVNDVNQLLPTIRSRAQVIRFSGLDESELKQVRPGVEDWMYRSARGQLGRLEELASSSGLSKREEVFLFFEQFCLDPDFLGDKTWKDSVKDRAWATFAINCWLQFVRDLIVFRAHSEKDILGTDQVERFKRLYEASENKISFLAKELISVEREIGSNFDPVLAFENLWIEYARVD